MENIPHAKTRDVVAQQIGFGNGKTYEQAKPVVRTAAPELVEAMDAKITTTDAGRPPRRSVRCRRGGPHIPAA